MRVVFIYSTQGRTGINVQGRTGTFRDVQGYRDQGQSPLPEAQLGPQVDPIRSDGSMEAWPLIVAHQSCTIFKYKRYVIFALLLLRQNSNILGSNGVPGIFSEAFVDESGP